MFGMPNIKVKEETAVIIVSDTTEVIVISETAAVVANGGQKILSSPSDTYEVTSPMTVVALWKGLETNLLNFDVIVCYVIGTSLS